MKLPIVAAGNDLRKIVLHFVILSFILVVLEGAAFADFESMDGKTYSQFAQDDVRAKLDLHSVVPLSILTNDTQVRYEKPNDRHEQGMQHAAIYHYLKNGHRYFLKTVDARRFYDADDFARDVYGVALAANLGGPQLYRAGLVEAPDGRTRFYLEIEELFFGRVDTFTLKGLESKRLKGKPVEVNLKNSQILKIAKMIRLALEKSISFGLDVDLIFSADDVYWIDTGGWSYLGTVYPTEVRSLTDLTQASWESDLVLSRALSLENRIAKFDVTAAHALARAVAHEIVTAKIWNQKEKDQILSRITRENFGLHSCNDFLTIGSVR